MPGFGNETPAFGLLMSARTHYDTSVSCCLHLYTVTSLLLTKSVSFPALFPFLLLLIIILLLFTSDCVHHPLSSKYHSSILSLLFPNLFIPLSCMQVSRLSSFSSVYDTVRTTEAASLEAVFVCCYFISKLSQNFFNRLLIARKVWNVNQIRIKPVSPDEYT